MNICVLGKTLLAETVTDCCKRHFTVSQNCVVEGQPPDLVWACYDTPLSADGADFQWVIGQIQRATWRYPVETPFLVSSQLPVGTIKHLEHCSPGRPFAYSPENLRVAHAEADFIRQERVIVGYRNPIFDPLLHTLFKPFTWKMIVTSPETAEMVKHALNAYLGMNIAFANEIAKIAKAVGADMAGIERALLTERRISPEAPLHAGAPFGKGHLARDLHTLEDLSRQHGLSTPLLMSILQSNNA